MSVPIDSPSDRPSGPPAGPRDPGPGSSTTGRSAIPSDSTFEPEADLARSGPLLARFADDVARLVVASPAELVAVVGNPAADAGERLAAGTLLALLGDPRIDPLRPAMVDIPGGTFRMGLDADEVDQRAHDARVVGDEVVVEAAQVFARLFLHVFQFGADAHGDVEAADGPREVTSGVR